MPITLTPTERYRLLPQEVRLFVSDQASRNHLLLYNVQFSDEKIIQAYELAVSKVNSMPPLTTYQVGGIPEALRYPMLVGTLHLLCLGEAAYQTRNRVTAQDGDVAPSGIFDKSAEYLQLGKEYQAEFETLIRGWKTQVNAEAMYGGFSSGYVTRRVRRRI